MIMKFYCLYCEKDYATEKELSECLENHINNMTISEVNNTIAKNIKKHKKHSINNSNKSS